MNLDRYCLLLLYPALLLALGSCQQKKANSLLSEGKQYYSMGDDANQRFQYGDALWYYRKAQESFTAAGDSLELWRAIVSRADTYTTVEEWAGADSLFTIVLGNASVEDETRAQALLGFARLKANQPKPDPEGARECFIQAVEEYHIQPDPADYYVYGYVSALLGDPKNGLSLIDQYQNKDSSTNYLGHYYKYKIYASLNNDEYARLHYSAFRVGFYSSQERRMSSHFYDLQFQQLSNQRKKILLTGLTALLLMSGIIGLLFWMNRKKKAELDRQTANLLALSEELESALQKHSDTEASAKRIRDKFKELFQTQFKMLERLYIAFNTPDPVKQDAVFGEASQLLKMFNSDSEKQHQFEQYLNDELDGIMFKFRSDFPKLKESDYRLFSYGITGFSARTIASLTGFTTGSVYTKKNALKSMIAASGSVHKELFFRYL